MYNSYVSYENVILHLSGIGFMCLDTEESAGNMGMLDMVTALEWVQKNIKYFGGDPDQVTIFGESAGSASIGHLLLSQQTSVSHFSLLKFHHLPFMFFEYLPCFSEFL